MKELQDLLPPDAGWVPWRVDDINDNGWIVGADLDGQDQGFILIPLGDGDVDYGTKNADRHIRAVRGGL